MEPSFYGYKASTGIKILIAFWTVRSVSDFVIWGEWCYGALNGMCAGLGIYGFMKRDNTALLGFEGVLLVLPIIASIQLLFFPQSLVSQTIGGLKMWNTIRFMTNLPLMPVDREVVLMTLKHPITQVQYVFGFVIQGCCVYVVDIWRKYIKSQSGKKQD